MSTAILLDGMIENGLASVHASSQSGGYIYPLSKEDWTGSAKFKPAGTYVGNGELNAVLKVFAVGDYNESIVGVQPVPTDAVIVGKGNGTAVFESSSDASDAFKLVLTRNSSDLWDYEYTANGEAPVSGQDFPDEYDGSGGGGYRWTITEGTAEWEEGDTITVYFYQISVKLSTDGGATFGAAEDLVGEDTWTESEFVYSVYAGVKVRFILDSITAPAVANDQIRFIAGFSQGINNLSNASRLKRWIASVDTQQMIFVDNGTPRDFDMIKLYDKYGVVSVFTSDSDNLCDSCVGTFATVGTTSTLSHSGTWYSGLAGTIFVTSGLGMGKSYAFTEDSASTITIASDPADDGVAAGDAYLIKPNTTILPALTALSASSLDTKYYDTQEDKRGVWVVFTTAGFGRARCSVLRIGTAIIPEIPMNFEKGRRIGLRNDTSETSPGDILIRPGGYKSEVREIVFERILETDRDSILDEIDAYNNLSYARGMIIVPDMSASESIYGAIVEGPETDNETDIWSTLSFKLKTFPTE
jgi:hypothetical protein